MLVESSGVKLPPYGSENPVYKRLLATRNVVRREGASITYREGVEEDRASVLRRG